MEQRKKSIRLLNFIEEKGNKLPDPVTIFIIFTLLVIGLSHVLYVMGTSVSFEGVNNETGQIETLTVKAVSLLVPEGIAYMFSNVVTNFTSFVALGPVLVAMLGVGVAEKSGYISALMTNTVTKAPRNLSRQLLCLWGSCPTSPLQSVMLCLFRSALLSF